MEILFADLRIGRRDIEHIYGALFLAAFTSFEGMIEDLFLKLLVSRVVPPAGSAPRVLFKSDRVAKEIVSGGRKYIDWLPYYRTEDRAKLFFSGARPFADLSDNEKLVIRNVCIIRNAIAHQGSYARSEFTKKVIGNLPLTPRERTPVGFLRSPYGVAPRITRYQQLTNELSSTAWKLVI
jgi:hypothetical protein